MPAPQESLQHSTTHRVLESPIGDLTVVTRGTDVVGLYFPGHWNRPDRATFGQADDMAASDVCSQLEEYFTGRRRIFDLPLRADGDGRQRKVWGLIGQVPYGETTTYGELAQALGDGTTPQEVGASVGQNPLSILVACHRIVGAGGKLVGYAGGLRRKQFLLQLERDMVERPARLF